jgi:prepilin-type N-terminal cleavage/methylation domain-containing protein
MKLNAADFSSFPCSRSLARGRKPVSARGLTLVEVLITMVIFVILAGFTIMAVKEVVTQWAVGERRRVVYEKAAGCLDMMAEDIRLALTQEPVGVTEIRAKLIGDYDPVSRQQRLMFVRTFESGPERAITFNAGDGRDNAMLLKPQDDTSKIISEPSAKSDSEDFTGLRVGDFKPLGGMALIGYFVQNRTLYRVIHAPVPDVMSSMLTTGNAQVLATDVLYMSFDYWSQDTEQWEEPPPKSKTGGPEKVWDSTRAISANSLNNFRYHRGSDSALDEEDDIFPRKIRVTLTTDSPMPRCVNTKLINEISEHDGGAMEVDSTRGFPDGGDETSYILVEDEWMHYKSKTADGFVIDKRGARGTIARAHKPDAVIRTGKTFRRIIYLPNYREDLTSDEDWRARIEAKKLKRKRVIR